MLEEPSRPSPRAVFEHALVEGDRLATPPRSRERKWCWEEEFRCAASEIAARADHDPAVVRRAMFYGDGSRAHRRAVKLLHEAVRYAWNEPRIITGGTHLLDRDGS